MNHSFENFALSMYFIFLFIDIVMALAHDPAKLPFVDPDKVKLKRNKLKFDHFTRNHIYTVFVIVFLYSIIKAFILFFGENV